MNKIPYITGIVFLFMWAIYNHVVAYDFGTPGFIDDAVLRHFIFYVMIYQTIAGFSLFISNGLVSKFEKRTFLLIFIIVSYHILLEIIALISFPNDIDLFKGVVNNTTLDNLELICIILCFIYNLWYVSRSSYGKSVWQSFLQFLQRR